MPSLDRMLLGVGLAHAFAGAVCLAFLRTEAPEILGVHPAEKPLKFAVSIAVFLLTMAVLLPALSLGEGTRRLLAFALSLTMVVEMTIIATQALRGRRSHFNVEQPLDAALTGTMFLGIVVLLVAMGTITLVATARPLAQSPLLAAAWRAALWIFLLSAVSGVGMGGRGRHTVGGDDGGPGMAVTHWSTDHGDLRVSHFFALHALQVIPLVALVLSWLPLASGARWAALALGVALNVVLVGWSWVNALAGRPFG